MVTTVRRGNRLAQTTTIAPAQLAAAAYYNRRRQLRRAQHFGVLDRPGLPHNRRSGE